LNEYADEIDVEHAPQTEICDGAYLEEEKSAATGETRNTTPANISVYGNLRVAVVRQQSGRECSSYRTCSACVYQQLAGESQKFPNTG
jgi:hypothetical protein